MGNLTCTASGSVANFYTPYAVPIRSFKVHFSPKQAGSGDPSPSNVRPIEGWTGVTGYRDKKSVVWNQWLKPLTGDDWKAYNTNNITIVYSDGIATSTWLVKKYGYEASIRTKVGASQTQGDVLYVSYMVNPSLSGLAWGVEFGFNNQITCIYNAPANVWQRCSCIARCKNTGNNHTYISYCRTPATDDFIGMTAQTKSPILINLTQMFGAGNEPETAEEFEAQCALNGINLDEYQAYDEGTAIGWKTADTDEIPISFPAVGKNIWDEVWDFGAIHNVTGSPYPNPNSPRIYSVNYIPVIPGVRYYASIASWIALYDKDKNLITDWNPEGVTRTDNVYNINRFTAPDNCYYFRFYTSASYAEGYKNTGFVVRNDEPDKTYEPYLGNTFYSGSIDLITGEMVATHVVYTITGDETDSKWGWNGYLIPKSDSVSDNSSVHVTHCSHTYRMITGGYFYASRDSTSQNDFVVCAASTGAQLRFRNRFVTDAYSTNEEKLAALKAWLQEQNALGTPVQIVYELATPITHTLSPQTLSTLVHDNAFWSNADSVEIEYDLAECGDIKEIRRRILLNTPHLESASGSVAHFSTDMASKLKECKVNFLPQQAGSGDPSPDNVRAISGWTDCDVVRSGKNLLKVCAENLIYNSYIRERVITYTDDGVNIVINSSHNWHFFVYTTNILITEDMVGLCFKYSASQSFGSDYVIVANADGSGRDNTNDGVILNRHVGKYLCVRVYPGTPGEYYIQNIQLELGSESTAYEPYQSNQITVSWQDLGMIYGGFIDVLRGELVATYGFKRIVGNESWIMSGAITGFCAYRPTLIGFAPATGGYSLPICDKFKGVDQFATREYWATINQYGNFYFGAPEELSTSEAVNAWVQSIGGIDVAYPLATPITYPLTPEIIKAIKGVNNVFSDANGDVNVKFWTH